MDRQLSNSYKGLAILIIILCHAAGKFGQGHFVLFTPLGGIGVAIFLLLSAYGLNESWNKPENVAGGVFLGGSKDSSQYGFLTLLFS